MIQVQSVGIWNDPTVLVGEVKLEEGNLIELIRDDAHNSIIINNKAVLPPHMGVTLAYLVGELFAPPLPSPKLSYSVS